MTFVRRGLWAAAAFAAWCAASASATAEPSISLYEKLAADRAEAFLKEQEAAGAEAVDPSAARTQSLLQDAQYRGDRPRRAERREWRREGRRAERREARREFRDERRRAGRREWRDERRRAERREWRRDGRRAERRAWRRERAIRRNGRLYAPPRAYRRGRVLPPRYYRKAKHGPRFRYRHNRYVYFYDGWWYLSPWWLLSYSPGATVVYDYPVEVDAYGGGDVYDPGYGQEDARCSYWSDRCVQNWGFQNPNYYGCLRYHGCD